MIKNTEWFALGVAVVLGVTGTAILVRQCGWWMWLGVVLLMWGNNVSLSIGSNIDKRLIDVRKRGL